MLISAHTALCGCLSQFNKKIEVQANHVTVFMTILHYYVFILLLQIYTYQHIVIFWVIGRL